MPFHIEQFYLGCLAHASYMVESGGEAAVIDPQRDVDLYLDTARERGWRIAHIIETHLHADFVSGHRELAGRTGAAIYLGARSGASFPHVPATDGFAIPLGDCRLEFLETPGHTLESVSILLWGGGRPCAVFTGDTLFVGDVGRPDLAADHTPQELAGMLYDSLHGKLLRLPEETEVYPAHGAGSLCGRQMSADRSSTIGRERRSNYALLAGSRDEFVRMLTEDLPPRPAYFRDEVERNRRGAAPIAELPAPVELDPDRIREMQQAGCVVLDTRPVMEFAVAHLSGSVHIGLSGQYASWAARVLGVDSRIVLVAEDAERGHEARLRLARVGIENVEGCLRDGIPNWIRAGYTVDYLPQISVHELAEWMSSPPSPAAVLDVREPGEWSGGVIAGSTRIPLGSLMDRARELDRDRMLFVHCKGGYRSSIASSLLRRAGFPQVANVTGGFDAWCAAKLPVASVPAEAAGGSTV